MTRKTITKELALEAVALADDYLKMYFFISKDLKNILNFLLPEEFYREKCLSFIAQYFPETFDVEFL